MAVDLYLNSRFVHPYSAETVISDFKDNLSLYDSQRKGGRAEFYYHTVAHTTRHAMFRVSMLRVIVSLVRNMVRGRVRVY